MQIIGPDGKGAVAYHDASNMHSRLLMERVKIFSDGSLGAETAALRVFPKPSASSGADSASVSTSCDASAGFKSNEKGVLVHEKSALTSMLADAYRAGYRVEVHAIGDAAAEFVLSALEASEALIQGSSVPDHFDTLVPVYAQRHWRPLLTHCQVLGADLIERMAALGVVANVQPPFVPTGNNYIHQSGLILLPKSIRRTFVLKNFPFQ